MEVKNIEAVKRFFTKVGPDKWNCTSCNKDYTQKNGTGMTNLIAHLKQVHTGYQNVLQDAGGMAGIAFCASVKSTSIFKYLEFIVVDRQPFSIVESPRFRYLCSMTPISTQSIMNT